MCIISPGSSCASADLKCLGKLVVDFELVSHLVPGKATTEDPLVDICLLGPYGRFTADRRSHVRPFSTLLRFQTFHNASAHMWWHCRIAIWNKNRIAVAFAICAWTTSLAFQIHSKSTVFLPNHSFIESSVWFSFCIDLARVSIPPTRLAFSGFIDSLTAAPR